MHQARKYDSGTLTLRTDDGYVVEAPIVGFSVRSEADYAGVEIDQLLDSHSIYTTSQSVIFEAQLKPGENYTVRDIGKDIDKTLAIKGNMLSERSALGVPSHAKGTYDSISDTTHFSWTDRLITEEPAVESCDFDCSYCNPDDEEDDYHTYYG